VFGHSYDTLRTEADRVAKAVGGVDGVRSPQVVLPVDEPTLEVEVNLDKAQALGVKPGDVRRAAATVLSGVEVGNLFEQQKVFEVVVWGTPDTRASVDRIRQLLIDRPDGAGQVRLSDVAEVRMRPSPNVIRHEDVSRFIDVGMDVSGRDVGAVASDVRARIRATQFPVEYHAELLGDYADRASARLRFIGLFVAAAIGVFLLLQAAFASWRLAAMGFLALAAALSGGVAAVLLDSEPLSIGSLAAFFAIFAVAARHMVVFVRRCHDLEDYEEADFGADLVSRVAHERMAPTITAAVGTALVFLPFLFLGDRAGLEIVRPMSAVVLGGLVTATLVDLFVTPVLYLQYGFRPNEARERFDMTLGVPEPAEAHATANA
jgi:Cu/Ag efflux pump CusA